MFDDDFPPRPGPKYKAGPLPSPGELLRLVGLNPKVRVISPTLHPEEWARIKAEEDALPPAPNPPDEQLSFLLKQPSKSRRG